MRRNLGATLIILVLSCGGDPPGTGSGDGSSSGNGSTSAPTTEPLPPGSTETVGETQASMSGGLDGSTTDTSAGVDFTTGVDSTTGADCEPQTEVCNGVDDDCNDEIDEGFAVGERCELGLGACVASGTFTCDDRGSAACDAIPGRPSPESCNGVDDDCNGLVDDAVTQGACIAQVGTCELVGALDCAGTCVGNPPPGGMVESCNGLDDDCDGTIDENLIFSPCANGGGICTCFESDANGNPQGAGPFDAYRTCAPAGGYYFWLCDPALGCAEYPAGGCMFGGFHP